MKDSLAEPRLENLGYHEVDFSGEEILQEFLEAHVVVESLGARFELAEEVEVAIRSGLASDLGAEQAQPASPETSNGRGVLGEGTEDLVFAHGDLWEILDRVVQPVLGFINKISPYPSSWRSGF